MNTHHLVCDFGKHKGTAWTRVPVSYLKWIKNQSDFSPERKAIAEAELERRGTVTPEMDISGHAIDRASMFCLEVWERTRNDHNEGIHAWLVRLGQKALKQEPDKKGQRVVEGVAFCFEMEGEWPVLKTVLRLR